MYFHFDNNCRHRFMAQTSNNHCTVSDIPATFTLASSPQKVRKEPVIRCYQLKMIGRKAILRDICLIMKPLRIETVWKAFFWRQNVLNESTPFNCLQSVSSWIRPANVADTEQISRLVRYSPTKGQDLEAHLSIKLLLFATMFATIRS